ncbi:MAG: dethiobiotin synthase [Planctomycetota bacterium]
MMVQHDPVKPCVSLTCFTGVGTEVGKTHVASQYVRARVAAGASIGVCKPVASGCRPSNSGELLANDAIELWHAAGQTGSLDHVCPQRFAASLSPPAAASEEETSVDWGMLVDSIDRWMTPKYAEVVAEGAGGLFSPIADARLNIDLVKVWRDRYPTKLILVAVDRLGVQHDVISAVKAAAADGCHVDCVVLNRIPGRDDASSSKNIVELRKWLSIPIHHQATEI